MAPCPTCGIEPTCTCNVFTPTPAPCRIHGGLRKINDGSGGYSFLDHPKKDVPSGPARKDFDRHIFQQFLEQPDGRSRELM